MLAVAPEERRRVEAKPRQNLSGVAGAGAKPDVFPIEHEDRGARAREQTRGRETRVTGSDYENVDAGGRGVR